jgi:hypothetical protein
VSEFRSVKFRAGVFNGYFSAGTRKQNKNKHLLLKQGKLLHVTTRRQKLSKISKYFYFIHGNNCHIHPLCNLLSVE